MGMNADDRPDLSRQMGNSWLRREYSYRALNPWLCLVCDPLTWGAILLVPSVLARDFSGEEEEERGRERRTVLWFFSFLGVTCMKEAQPRWFP